MRDDHQASDERRIFKLFAARADLAIVPNTVRSRKPPEPDISCRTAAGEVVAFELVEIVDVAVKRGRADQPVLQQALSRAWASRPMLETKGRYSNAMLAVWFNRQARKVARLAAIPAVIDMLIAQKPEPRGEVEFARVGPLKAVARVFVHTGEFAGPCFDVTTGGYFIDPLVEAISRKLRKRYATGYPIELLAFYDLQSPAPKSIGLPTFPEELLLELSESSVRRVWVYDVNEDEVLLERRRLPH